MINMTLHLIDDLKITVIGLGYVGLPLAVEFGKSRPVVGFDINASRITQLQKGHGATQSQILIMGLTFKENCPDLRNNRVVVRPILPKHINLSFSQRL